MAQAPARLDDTAQRALEGWSAERSLPGVLYRDPQIYESELERIFFKSWLYVGHMSQVPERGDYFLFEIAGESVILVRDGEGQVNALLNVCRHRGSRICDAAAGRASRLVCRYHGWTYGLDGSLRAAAHTPAGFDKNAEVVGPLVAAGFGFVEVGAATPLPQPGNPRPRLFRLDEDRGAINRFGFNNQGVAAIATRLAARRPGGVVGLNLGANKASADRAADYAAVLAAAGRYVDFATVNVSSPNTERLRELQGAEALERLLAGVAAANRALERPVPLFLKIAPELSEAELEALVGVALEAEVAGIIATNTTLAREGLTSRHAGEAGGLSGAPLFARSTAVLARVHALTGDSSDR